MSTSVVVDIRGIIINRDIDEGREATARAGAGGGTSVIGIRTAVGLWGLTSLAGILRVGEAGVIGMKCEDCRKGRDQSAYPRPIIISATNSP